MTDRHWTPRETEIVRLTTEGLTAQQIARRLTLAPKTVENHIWRAKQKADCPNRAALVRYAITRGLVAPPPRPPVELDREDAGLDLLIRHLDTGIVVDHLDADAVIDVRDDPADEEVPAGRPRRGIAVVVLVLLTLTGVTVYGIVQAPDPPAAAVPATTTVTVVTSVTVSPTTRPKTTATSRTRTRSG